MADSASATFKMGAGYIAWIIVVTAVVRGEFTQEFMMLSCGSRLSPRVSGRLELTTSLTYANDVDCQTTVGVSDGKRILVLVRRFDLEDAVSGTCPDHLTVYDGADDTAAAILYRKCGSEVESFEFNTSSNHVTLHFVSDASAVFRGFELEYTAFSEAPCTSGEFQCDRGICIDEGNRCDDVNQCGDYSDESQCTDDEEAVIVQSGWTLEEIIGCAVGILAFLIIVIVVAVKLYQRYKKRYHIEQLSVDSLYEYPITDKYNKYRVGIKGRRKPRHLSFYSDVVVLPPSDSGSKQEPAE